MDEEIERLLVSVRADTSGFARDVADMRAQLEGPLAQGAGRAGLTIEAALLRAVRTGKLGFEDLKHTALTVMSEIAAGAIRAGIGALTGGGEGGGGGLAALASQLIGALLGLPGRAGGGPVAPGRAYLVGERGPELFVPTASGRVEAGGGAAAPRDIRMSITVNAPAGAEPEALAKSSRQVARAVREALLRVED
ncbi:MAG: tail tape measure protein [Alphaproteobacteria bacterium]|nr:tail tape measure protein [Alphaproteobacteria bacterium]